MVKTTYKEERITIPNGVEVKIDESNNVTIKGPKSGPITKNFSHARGIKFIIQDNEIIISSYFPRNKTQALIGTIRSIIQNLITGVQTNYKYVCIVCYSHFPCNVEKRNNELYVVNFLGERAPRKSKISPNVDVEIQGDEVILTGPDKEALGQTAVNLKRCCRIRKKDPRVFMDGTYLHKIMLGDEIIWEIK